MKKFISVWILANAIALGFLGILLFKFSVFFRKEICSGVKEWAIDRWVTECDDLTPLIIVAGFILLYLGAFLVFCGWGRIRGAWVQHSS